MGRGYGCKCKKCGYSVHISLGGGFGYPLLYEKTVEAMKQGKYGIQGENFFEKFPNGAITCERVVAKCSACGNYFDIPSLDLYIPKGATIRTAEDNEKVWSVAVPLPDSDFVAPIDLEEKYELFERYNHKCTKCGASVEIVENFENLMDNENLKCLKCKDGIMEITDMIFWD